MPDHERISLEQELRDFEPVFWVGPWGESLERLYEPDGTLYAICLDGPVIVATDRRRVTVNRGDLVILPPQVAVELSRPVRWFGIVYSGPYPYHFRERFIQVWGFEHVPCHFGHASPDSSEPAYDARASSRDLRHRMYASFSGERNFSTVTSPEFFLCVKLDSATPEGFRISWKSPAGVGLTDLQRTLSVERSPEMVVLEIPTEAIYLTHRLARPPAPDTPAMSPEYRPEG